MMDKPLSAIILAAGRGSRMDDLTCFQPKCFCLLAGRSLLEWQLAALHDAGIHHVTIVAGYQSGCLMSLDCSSRPEVAVVDNPRWEQTNMVTSLLCAEEVLRAAPCIVSYSDIVYHPDRVRALCDTAGDIAITYDRLWHNLWRDRFCNVLFDAETFRVEGGRVVEIGARPLSMDQVQGQYMGLLKFTPSGWSKAEKVLINLSRRKIDEIDLTSLLQILIDSEVEVKGIPVDGKWCEVDRASDLALYATKLNEVESQSALWSHDWRW